MSVQALEGIPRRGTKGTITGFAKPGFEPVLKAFIENFEHRRDLGSACCVYHRSEKVVDIWSGVRDKTTGDPWDENTMACVA